MSFCEGPMAVISPVFPARIPGVLDILVVTVVPLSWRRDLPRAVDSAGGVVVAWRALRVIGADRCRLVPGTVLGRSHRRGTGGHCRRPLRRSIGHDNGECWRACRRPCADRTVI